MFQSLISNISSYHIIYFALAILSLWGVSLIWQGFSKTDDEVPVYPQPREYEKGSRLKVKKIIPGWLKGGFIGICILLVESAVLFTCSKGYIPIPLQSLKEILLPSPNYLPYEFSNIELLIAYPVVYFVFGAIIAVVFRLLKVLAVAKESTIGIRRIGLSLAIFPLINIGLIFYAEFAFIQTGVTKIFPAVPDLSAGIVHLLDAQNVDVSAVKPYVMGSYLPHFITIGIFLFLSLGFLCLQSWAYFLLIVIAILFMINAVSFFISFPGEYLQSTINNCIYLIYFAFLTVFCIHPDVKKQFNKKFRTKAKIA